MRFYAYRGSYPLGEEPATPEPIEFRLQTVRGAHARARRTLGPKYRLYRFSNWADLDTYEAV